MRIPRTPPTLLWRLASGRHLHWRVWGDEHVLYEAGSGDTHLFETPLAKRVLDLLGQEAVCVEELARRLDAEQATDEPACTQAAVQEILIELRRCGLVESLPGDSQ